MALSRVKKRERGGQRHCPVWRGSEEVSSTGERERESEEVNGTVQNKDTPYLY